MKTQSKSMTYLGFAIKAGKLRTGINAIKTLRDRANLVVLSRDGEKNAVKEAKKIAAKHSCPVVVSVNATLEEITGKKNCKVAALVDENLTKAILDNLGDDFRLLSDTDGGLNGREERVIN